MFTPPIKSNGRSLKKKPIPAVTGNDLVNSIGSIQDAVSQIKQTENDVIETVNNKISEVNTVVLEGVSELQNASQTLENTRTEVLDHIKSIKTGEAGLPGRDGKDGKSADETKITKTILAKVPKEKDLVKKVIEAIPKSKASLKIIQEKFETDPMSVIEKIMAMGTKFKIKTENIDGLSQTLSAFNSQLGRGYLHGGGDTVVAGTNVTITTNAQGQKVISASGSTLTLTTTGTSGASTYDSGTGTLNIPIYAGTTYTGTADRITVTGSVIDIAATYVGQTSITTLGTIATGTWQGTAIGDSYISSASNWNTAYTNRITSLTNTGTSGNATLLANVLNIPNYTYTLPTSSTTVLGGVKVDGTSITITGGVISATASGGGTVTSVASADGSITVTNPTSTVDLAVVKAPILTTARTIGGVSFDGSANITVASATGGFTVSGGNFLADTTTLAVDATNHRVGIGTTSPGVVLDIIGTSIRQSNTATDATNKAFRFQTRNFTNAQNDFLLVFGQSKTSANTLILGGGQTGSVAASTVSIFTGAGNNTDTGTARLTVDASGNVLIANLTGSKVVFTDSSKNLTSTGIGTSSQFIKGDGSLDSSTYLTANQTITLSGDVTGSGATAITTVVAAIAGTTVSGTTGSGNVVFATSPTLTTAVLGSSTATTQAPGDNSTKVATTAYVQAAIFATQTIAACKYATTVNLAATYSNGSSGVGATLTEIALGALSVDGSTPSVNDRILVKNQSSTFQNGIYVVTVVGSAGVAYVLTRSTDYNVAADINLGDTVFVSAGSTQASTTWTQNGTENPVMGTDAITFAQTAGPGSYTAGNGLTLTGTSFSIDTSITVDKTTAQTLTNKTLTSPILTTPDLGTPSALVGTNITGTGASFTAGKATILANARTIGGVSFDGSANITVATATGGFTVSGGNLTTSAINIATDTTTGTKFGTATNQKIGFYNATPIVQPTGDVITALQNLGLGASLTVAATTITSRTLWGQTYDGSGNVSGSLTAVGDITGGASNMTITSGTGASRTLIFKTTTSGSTATTALTIGADQSSTFAGTVALGANNLTMTGSLAATGARVTKGWFTDLESTNMPTVGGTAILTSLTAPQFTTIELGAASDTTLARVSAGVISIEGVTIPTISSTSTITNKRNQPRITSAASYTTNTGTSLDVSTTDIFIITAQAGALLFNNPSGTPVQGEKLIIRIKDNGTARALTYDTQFRASSDLALPTTTVLSKTLYMGFIYNSTDTKWDLLAVLNNF